MKSAHYLRIIAALLLGLGLVAALFQAQQLNLSTLADLPIHWEWVWAMLAGSVLYVFLGAYKWQAISRCWYGSAPNLHFHFWHTAKLLLWAQLMPLPVATALNRAEALHAHQHQPVAGSLAHAAYDLGFDLLVVLLLVPISLMQLNEAFAFSVWLMDSFAILLFASLILWRSGWLLQILQNALACFALTHRFVGHIAAWRQHGLLAPHFMLKMLWLSGLRYAVIMLRLCCGASALGFSIGWDAITTTTPLATLPSLLPLTPASLGVAEWSWAYLLSLWQIPLATGALYATGYRLLTLSVQTIITTTDWIFRQVQKKRA